MDKLAATLSIALVGAALSAPAYAGWPGDSLPKCPADSVKVGATCVDKYEASVWQLPAANLNTKPGKALIAKIQKGKATLTDLTAGGAVQLGCTYAPFNATAYPAEFPEEGNWTPVAGTTPPTPGIYAVSIAGAQPTTCTTWFQAEQACALSNKRLIRNQEWQRAAAGTKDPGANNGLANTKCNTSATGARNTGLAGTVAGDVNSCISNWGAQDMVGNVWEWVGDWGDQATNCRTWYASYGSDLSCVGGDGSDNLPGALIRGGSWDDGAGAGVFAVKANYDPSFFGDFIGLRCAR